MKRTRVRASLFSVDARTPSLKQYPGARARSRQDDEDEVEKGGWLKEGPQARARRRGHFILTSSDDKTCSETSARREGKGVKVFTKPYPGSLRERLVLRWFHVSNRVPGYQSPMISVAPHFYRGEMSENISALI